MEKRNGKGEEERREGRSEGRGRGVIDLKLD